MTTQRNPATIRAITLHVTRTNPDYIEGILSKFLEEVDEVKKTLEIDTIRLVTPKVSAGNLEDTASKIYTLAENYSIDLFAVPLAELPQPQKIAEIFSDIQTLYTSIEYREENSNSIIQILKTLSEKSWIHPTRFAVSFGKRYNTPYFPATASSKEGTTVSLFYIELYKDNPSNISVIAEKLYTIASQLKETFNNFLGIDYSLSPWMEQSVAEVIEKKSGTQFTLPGTIDAIIRINNEISKLSENMGIGYNEIMLPLGEDNRLKELALAGQLHFSHLLNYTTYCVAGLDMVPIPDTTDASVIEGILRDLYAIHRKKGKTIGMRIIPVGLEEGEEVDLGIFGRVPVLNPLF